MNHALPDRGSTQMLSFSGYSLPQLEELLIPADHSQTECDGCSRLVSHLLSLHQVQHTPRTGKVIAHDGQTIALHCWVELQDQTGAMWRIDYRLRQLLGEGYPHGILLPLPQHPLYLHSPRAIFGGLLSQQIFWALTLQVDNDAIDHLLSQRSTSL